MLKKKSSTIFYILDFSSTISNLFSMTEDVYFGTVDRC